MKNKVRKFPLISGIVLIVLQCISISGNAKVGRTIWESPNFMSMKSIPLFLYDLFSLCSYLAIGIIGLILMIVAFLPPRKKRKDISEEKAMFSTDQQIKEENPPVKEENLSAVDTCGLSEPSTEEKCLTVSSGRCYRPGDKTRISLYVVSSLLVISLIGFGIACPLLTQNAYASGYSEGYATGKEEGKNDGRHIGYNEGYRDGIGEYEEAYNKGFDEGLYHAYEDDSSQGFSLSEYVRDKRMWTKLHEEGKTDLSFDEWYEIYTES